MRRTHITINVQDESRRAIGETALGTRSVTKVTVSVDRAVAAIDMRFADEGKL